MPYPQRTEYHRRAGDLHRHKQFWDDQVQGHGDKRLPGGTAQFLYQDKLQDNAGRHHDDCGEITYDPGCFHNVIPAIQAEERNTE